MPEEENIKRFKILVCIDRTEDSFRGLRYAVRIGSGLDADITLLYVRAVDKGLSTGGLDIRMVRENLLEWGLELPGKKALKKARDMLIEMDFLKADWREKTVHTDVKGDPLGDNLIEYTSEDGRKITLKLMVSPAVDLGILDECQVGDYDITIVSGTEDPSMDEDSRFGQSVAQTVATEAKGTVLFARELEENHGHLLCVQNSDSSMEAVRKDAIIASRCFCPIYLFSVAETDEDMLEANAAINRARGVIEEMGLAVAGEKTAIGDPIEKIVEEGKSYSIIVVAASEKVGFHRFFRSNSAFNVLEKAYNSVMIVR